jgi:thiosulfate/3-mercaptopyruvate sulfurtransferase
MMHHVLNRKAGPTMKGGRHFAPMLLALSAFCLMGCTQMKTKMASPRTRIVCQPTELAGLIKRESVASDKPILLDVRPEPAFRQGHLKDAVWLDLAGWVAAAKTSDGSLDRAPVWYDHIGKLGVRPTDRVIVYDDGKMREAARVWFILQLFGVEQAAVLNGGYPAIASLSSKPLIVSDEPAQTRAPVAFHPAANARRWVDLAEKKAVLVSVEKHDSQVFDARTFAEYSGARNMKNPRVGHLPGAVNLSHEHLLDASGKLKSPEELRQLFKSAGLEPGERIITHCQSGGRASLAALAVVYAGYGPAANYYLSFGEWGKDDRCPLVTPTSRPE